MWRKVWVDRAYEAKVKSLTDDDPRWKSVEALKSLWLEHGEMDPYLDMDGWLVANKEAHGLYHRFMDSQ